VFPERDVSLLLSSRQRLLPPGCPPPQRGHPTSKKNQTSSCPLVSSHGSLRALGAKDFAYSCS
jgi:hypothetical protein